MVTSYQALHTSALHTMRHFIPWPLHTSHFIPKSLHTSHVILRSLHTSHFIPRSLHTKVTTYQSLHTKVTSYQWLYTSHVIPMHFIPCAFHLFALHTSLHTTSHFILPIWHIGIRVDRKDNWKKRGIWIFRQSKPHGPWPAGVGGRCNIKIIESTLL